MCLGKPGTFKECDHVQAQVYLMTPDEGGRAKPCVDQMQIMLFSRTWDCAAFMNLEGKEMAMPGEDATITLKLTKPMVLEEGQQFTVRDSSGTIGTGKITNVKANMTEEERELLMLNKEKRAKRLAQMATAHSSFSTCLGTWRHSWLSTWRGTSSHSWRSCCRGMSSHCSASTCRGTLRHCCLATCRGTSRHSSRGTTRATSRHSVLSTCWHTCSGTCLGSWRGMSLQTSFSTCFGTWRGTSWHSCTGT